MYMGDLIPPLKFERGFRLSATYAANGVADDSPGILRHRSATALRRQPPDRQGRRRRPRASVHSAMPGWKSDVGRRIDDLIVRTVPNVRKAVRWNSPWYGIEGEGWFLSYHVFTRYVKVTFLNGVSLDPIPPGTGKDPDSRWVKIYEGEPGRGAVGGVGAAGGGAARMAGVLTGGEVRSVTEESRFPALP